MVKQKTDWALVKSEFRKGTLSLKELALKFGVSYTNIRQRAGREKWTEQRKEVVTRAEQKAIEKESTSIADRIAFHAELTSDVLAKLRLGIAELDRIDLEGLASASVILSRVLPLDRLSIGLDEHAPAAGYSAEAQKPRIIIEWPLPSDDEEELSEP